VIVTEQEQMAFSAMVDLGYESEPDQIRTSVLSD